MKNLAVFVSGSGTNLENLAIKLDKNELINCKIALVVCDNPAAFALERAKKYKLKTVLIEKKNFRNQDEFEAKILEELKANAIDIIILAGYMRLVGKRLLEAYEWKIINIHPALLPKFPGMHAIRDAWEAGVPETGVTVHFVDQGIDTGPVIFKRKIERDASDTLESLEKKIHQAEYEIYPVAVQVLVDGRLSVVQNRVYLDGSVTPIWM